MKEIEWLEENEMKILKQIIIISGVQNELGSIIYTRPLTDNYNFKKKKEDDEKEKNLFGNSFQEYPKQENYPYDKLDEIILSSVRKDYPNSFCRNHSILLDVDKNIISKIKNRSVLKSYIFFRPNLDEHFVEDLCLQRIDINIYCNDQSKNLGKPTFYVRYDATEPFIMDNLSMVEFE